MFRTRLAGPVLLLLAEVGALTPFVEFSQGPMARVADGRICSGVLFTLVVLAFLLARRRRTGPDSGTVTPARARLSARRLVLHLLAYGLFFAWTCRLAGRGQGTPAATGVAVLWVLAAAAVGVTVFCVFSSLPELVGLAACRPQLIAAFGCGAALVLLTPAVQGLWDSLQGPAVAIGHALLQWTLGEGVVGRTAEGLPFLGTRRLLILVTPQCSGLEAFVAFWLLAGAVVFTEWAAVRLVRMAAVILLGTLFLYLFLSCRLYGLVVVGTYWSGKACVSLAHSQVGGIVLWAFAAAFLSWASRCCRSPKWAP